MILTEGKHLQLPCGVVGWNVELDSHRAIVSNIDHRLPHCYLDLANTHIGHI